MIFSYTLLDTFANCPRQAYERYWLKIKTIETDDMREGKRVHKELENRLGFNESLEFGLKDLEPVCQSILKRGIPLTERRVAVDRQLEPTGFFDGDCYIRSVLDVLLVSGHSAFIVDWKTGKNREAQKDPLQLELSAAQVFAEFPEVNSVTALNIYTKTAKPGTAHTWQRAELPELWRGILPLIHEIEQAEFDKNFPERPSGLCGFCPVAKCQHNRSPV